MKKKKKLHWNTGKRHAAKPDDERADAQLGIRCRPVDKEAWALAAEVKGERLSQWVIATLNEAAMRELKDL